MKYRQFGNTGLRVSQLGFGCGQLAGTVERQDHKEAVRTLELALDRGVNYFDTADIYAQGRCEELLGKTFQRQRSSVILASKAGYRLSRAGSFAARLKPFVRPLLSIVPGLRKSAQKIRGSQMSQEFSGPYLRSALEASLQRLRTDYLDLFQLHSPSATVLEAGEYIETLEKLKAEGKIRYYGVSCATVSDAGHCLAHESISAVQIPVNLLNYDEASGFLKRARRSNLAVVARQPFASGVLAGHPAGQKLASPTRTIAQAAIQFTLQAPAVSLVLPGMSSRAHLEENLRAPEAPALTEDEIEALTASLASPTT